MKPTIRRRTRPNQIVELADEAATKACFVRMANAMTSEPTAVGDGLFAVAKLASTTIMQMPRGMSRTKFLQDFNDLYLSLTAQAIEKEAADGK